MTLRTIIVGAGAAGLAAGRALKDAGHSPVIIEARDRIGGRAWSRYDLAPHPVEMGAEFIHGSTGVTWDLLRQLELGSIFAYRNHGPEVFEFVGDTLRNQTDPSAGSFFDVAEEIATIAASSIAGDTSIAAILDQALAARLGEHSEADTRLYANTLTVYVTEDLDRPGILGIRDMLTGGEPDPKPDYNFRVAEGYTAMWERLSHDLDVRLGTEVREISWSGEKVKVETTAGAFEADAAIITLPLGVLKAGSVTFTPPMPEAKQSAIAELGAGVVNKVVLEFEKAFWPESMGLLFTSLDSQCFWPSGVGRGVASPLLTWWTSGSKGREVAADLPGGVDSAVADLQRIFAEAGPLPALRSYEAVCWGTDPYARLAYSYIPVSGAGTRLYDALAKPAGNLFFAGEATIPAPASASVPGAIESGRRAAAEVLAKVDARHTATAT